MKSNIKTRNSNTQRNEFETQWQRRQQWHEQTEVSMPDDETLLRWAEKARETYTQPEVNVIPLPSRRHNRWIPYAAAACIAIVMAVFVLNRQNTTEDTLPTAKEVTVGGQTVRFLCNNGCSAQDVILSASEVIK